MDTVHLLTFMSTAAICSRLYKTSAEGLALCHSNPRSNGHSTVIALSKEIYCIATLWSTMILVTGHQLTLTLCPDRWSTFFEYLKTSLTFKITFQRPEDALQVLSQSIRQLHCS